MSRCRYAMAVIIAAINFSCYQTSLISPTVGRAVIKFCPAARAEDKKDFLKKFRLKPVASDIFGYDIAEWKFAPPELNAEKHLLGCATANSRQKTIIEDYEIEETRLQKMPSKKPDFLSQEGCLSDKELARWPEKFIKTEAAHEFLKEKKVPLWPNGIVMADEGFVFSHPDIKPVLKYDEKNQPIYWINPATKIREQVGDHATSVSCLAGGYRNGQGVKGVAAPGSYILPLILIFDSSTFGSFSSDVAIGLAYFRNLEKQGKLVFNVVNMSFSMKGNSKIIRAAIENLNDKIFVVSAGNSGDDGIPKDLGQTKRYPPSWRLPNIVVVSATDQNDRLAEFSNYGKKRVDVAAPGKYVCSCAKNGYQANSGTSFSAPLVSGTLSLLFSIDPFMHLESAKQALLLGADQVSYLDGKVRASKRLNVYNSVRLIHGLMYEFQK